MTIEQAEKVQKLLERRQELAYTIEMLMPAHILRPEHYQALGMAVMEEYREEILGIIKEAHQKIEQEISSL